MLNLFTKEKLFDLRSTTSRSPPVIKLAIFGAVNDNFGGGDTTRKVRGHQEEQQQQQGKKPIDSRLVLYLDDHRFLLCQFLKNSSESQDHQQQNVQQFYIPTDPNKGDIIAMCFNASCTTLLALTNQCYLYLIPLGGFRTAEDVINQTTRVILHEDARVLRCLSLRSPTSMVWWERPYSVQRSSIAIIGNATGQLVFVDLNQEAEFKLFTFVSGIEHLQLYDEAISKTLLVTCSNKFQHYLVLDPSRAALDPPPRARRTTSRTISTSSQNSSRASYLLSCVTNYAMLIDVDDGDADATGSVGSVLDPDTTIRPQLISICEDISGGAAAGGGPSPSTTVTTSNQTEFLDLLEDCLKMSVHPQPHTASIMVVKQNRPKYDFMNSPRNNEAPGAAGSSSDDATSVDSSTSDLSGTFCSVSLHRDFSLDIHEFAAPEFCSKSIVLAGSKLFLVTIDGVDDPRRMKGGHLKLRRTISKTSGRNGDFGVSAAPNSDQQLLKILDCGHRFFVLAYSNRIILVSKYFAEQRSYLSATSPRSPLLLKKSDSGRSAGGSGGSFRRKNYHYQGGGQGSGSGAGGSASTCVIEDFKVWELDEGSLELGLEDPEEEILNVFITTIPSRSDRAPDFSKISSAHYPPPTVTGPSGSIDLESILRVERAAIDAKLSPKINEIIRIDERFLVVTRSRCFTVWSREKSFGEYFHREICHLLDMMDCGSIEPGGTGQQQQQEGTFCEGDVITRAKYLVDCFIHRYSRTSPSIVPALSLAGNFTAPSAHPGQSWQFWLTRSALLLLQELSKDFDDTEPNLSSENIKRFNQIFRLFELARTPRRRVITALTHFHFWSRSLYYIRKFFETRILQELAEDERLFLAHQMLDCLLEKYTRALKISQKEESIAFLSETSSSNRKRALSDQYDKSTTLDSKDFNQSPEVFRKEPTNGTENYPETIVSPNFLQSQKENKENSNIFPVKESTPNNSQKDNVRNKVTRSHSFPNKSCNKDLERELYQFFRAYRAYYDIEITLERLLERGLFEMARFVALIQADYLQLVQLVLRKFPNLETQPKDVRTKILDLLTSTRVTYSLILSTRFLTSSSADSTTLPKQSIIPGCCIKLIQTYLDFVLKQLPHLSTSELFRLANVLQPSRFEVQLLMNNVLDVCNQTYLKNSSYMIASGVQVIESYLPIRKRDLLNLYMFVLILCLRKTHHRKHHPSNESSSNKNSPNLRLYDWNFLANVKAGFAKFLTKFGKTLDNVTSQATSRSGIGVGNEIFSSYRVSAGTFHSVAFESPRSNQLYIWGRFSFVHQSQLSKEFSYASPPSSSVRHLRSPLGLSFWSNLLPGVKILDVACGHQHTLVLSDVGVFSFGSSTFGQLGLGCLVLESRYPMSVERLQLGSCSKVVKISAGSYHSVAITEDGELFTWGWGLHGQLGHGSIDDEWIPRKVIGTWEADGARIVDIAAGYAHTVVLTNAGDVYVFGENSYSQLGIDMGEVQPPGKAGSSKIKFTTPQRLTPNERIPGIVKSIACGLFHTIAVVTIVAQVPPKEVLEDLEKNDLVDLGFEEKGYEGGEKLFCWGLDPKTWRVKMRSDRQSTHAQMNGSSNGGPRPEQPSQLSVYEYARIREISLELLIGKEPKIRKVVAGQSHTVILTEGGQCYSFGFGREGQLGLGSCQPSSPLIACPILELESIVDIAAGASHSLAVNSDGTVWGWGQNSDYQLDNSALDGVGPGSMSVGGASTPNSSRRNSLLSNLMKRGDEQLMTRLMSLQKNVEWIPIRISVPLEPIGSATNSGLLPERIEVPPGMRMLNHTTKDREAVKELIMECLIRYKDFLDYKSLLKRFNHFDYPQLCATVSYLINDPIGAYAYQLIALSQEIQMEFSENGQISTETLAKWSEELLQLSVYFITESVHKGRNHQLESYKLIESLIGFWREFESKQGFSMEFSLKNILQKLYLDSNAEVKSPYFGLNLFRVLQDQEVKIPDFRVIHKLDDQFMLQLLERTRVGIAENPNEIVQIQQFVEKLVNAQEMYRCPRNDPKSKLGSLTNFPLELTWKKIMNQFSRTANEPLEVIEMKENSKLLQDAQQEDSDGDEVEILIPSDLEESLEQLQQQNEESPEEQKENLLKCAILYVFTCGHVLTRRQVVKLMEVFSPSHQIEIQQYHESIKLVLENPKSPVMQALACPECHQRET